MREDYPNRFAKWEEDLPSPEELMPLSQTLITSHLALAFDIHSPNHHVAKKITAVSNHQRDQSMPTAVDFGGGDSTELGSGSVGGGDDSARTLKRPRLVWTPQLHKRFVDAVAHLGIKNAVPKSIMQLMSVEGLTRENVASHLQKYRLYLKRMQGFPGEVGNHGNLEGGGNSSHVSDPATDHLFASSPVPTLFLRPGRVSSENLTPSLMPVTTQAVVRRHLQPHEYHYNRQPNPFTAGQSQFMEHRFRGRQRQHQLMQAVHNYEESLESGNGKDGRKILTLFPTGND